MMTKWWKRNGLRGKHSFDAEQYWAYGCHCVLLGSQVRVVNHETNILFARNYILCAKKEYQKYFRKKILTHPKQSRLHKVDMGYQKTIWTVPVGRIKIVTAAFVAHTGISVTASSKNTAGNGAQSKMIL